MPRPNDEPVILNVDDNEDARRAKTALLRAAGFRVVEAGTGTEALTVAFGPGGTPDLVLLDVRLPDLDGFEVCARLKADSICQHVPVIHITAESNSPGDLVRCLEAGAETYLVQPVDGDVLVAAVRAVLRRRKKELESNLAREQAESEYRRLVDGAPFGIYRSTADGRFLSVNPTLVTLLGYSTEEELIGIPLSDIYRDPADRLKVVQAFEGKSFGRAETEWKRKDGHILTVALVGREVFGSSGQADGYEIFIEDISQRRALEEQLRHSHKMEAIGRLAGGVAHDFNNLLTVILGYTDMLLTQLGEGLPISQDLAEIKRAADRAASLTRQLLAFGRKQVLRMDVVDLNAVTTSVHSMIERLMGEGITVQLQLAPDLKPILGDVAQLERLMMNLALNGRDAMPGGGVLTFDTRNVLLSDQYVESHDPVVPGSYAMLSVSDTGTGMDAETKQHLFEPFFTTKPIGEGTGLGLATVYGIVKQLSGYIWVYSEIGLGTTFKLYLPEAVGKQQVDAEVAGVQITASPGREVILVVEDEPGVRALVAATLKRYGYTVLEASTPAEALTLSDRFHARIDLLLTDVVLPLMNGGELAGRIQASREDIRVLFMSGYSAEVLTTRGILNAGVELIEKPFSPRTLLDRVRELFDRGAPRSESSLTNPNV